VGWLAATYLALLGLTAVWLTLMRALGVDVSNSSDLPAGLGTEDSTLALAVVGVLVTVVAPIAEEVFFRGFFFTALRNWKGVPAAAIITGIVFGALHIGSAPAVFLVPLGMFGALLCLLYWRTGSLLPCIAVHAINNSVAYGVSQSWTWQIAPVTIGALATCGLLLAPVVARARPPSTIAAGAGSH
jgi:membrane protease YdiL (CAAX protease family)